jgi:hypothetical protein
MTYSEAQTENAKSMSYQGLSQRGINEKSVCIRGWSTKKHGHDGENVMSSRGCKPIEMLGLDIMQNKMCAHISYK